MADTKIQWAEKVWNPVTGCSPISPGCENCYAKRMANRLRGRYGYPKDKPFYRTFHPDRLAQPLRWQKPSRIFVCSMGDLYFSGVSPLWRRMVFDRIEAASQHQFLLLTKRPCPAYYELTGNTMFMDRAVGSPWVPRVLDNLWFGVSCENQEWADKRIPELLKIPAMVRFLSLEPLLSPVDLLALSASKISWVIIGSESGPKRRPCKLEWVRSIVEQCKAVGVPAFVKQVEVNGKVSHDMNEWPEDLQVQEYPKGD